MLEELVKTLKQLNSEGRLSIVRWNYFYDKLEEIKPEDIVQKGFGEFTGKVVIYVDRN